MTVAQGFNVAIRPQPTRAMSKQHVGRALHICHAPGRRTADDGHHFPLPIEGDFVLEWRRLLQRLFGHAEFRRQHEQRPFGGVTDDLPDSVLLVQCRAITQHSRREQLLNARSAAWKWRSFIGHLERLIADADFRDRHFVFR